MFTRRIKRSKETLDMICAKVYRATIFTKDIKVLEWGGTLCRTWWRSICGLTVASVWSQILSQKVTALYEIKDQAWEEASYVTAADRLIQQGVATEAPQSQTQLMVALDSFVVILHTTWGLEGLHQKQVVAICDNLRSQYAHEALPSKVCVDVCWAIFLDGRAFVEQDDGEATSGLDTLVANLYHHTMPALINVPYGNLTSEPEPLVKKRKTLDSGLNLGGKGEGGRVGKSKPVYGTVDHSDDILNAKWSKAEKAKPGLKFIELLPHDRWRANLPP
jgi:hypothetical protein